MKKIRLTRLWAVLLLLALASLACNSALLNPGQAQATADAEFQTAVAAPATPMPIDISMPGMQKIGTLEVVGPNGEGSCRTNNFTVSNQGDITGMGTITILSVYKSATKAAGTYTLDQGESHMIDDFVFQMRDGVVSIYAPAGSTCGGGK